MKLRVVVFAVVCALLALPVAAQTSSAGVWLYTEIVQNDNVLPQVVHVEPGGLTVVYALPQSFIPAPCADGTRALLRDAVISPDGRYLAAAYESCDLPMMQSLMVADVPSGTCCTSIPMPLSGLPVTAVDLGGIDPASGLLSYSFVTDLQENGGGPPVSGGMAVASVTSGENLFLIDMPTALGGISGAAQAPWALVESWQDGQVRFSETCYACEPRQQGEWRLWNPLTGVVIPGSGATYSMWADVLPSTGEMLYAVQVPSLPVSDEPSMFPWPNAIAYVAGGPLPSAEAAAALPLVYADMALRLPLTGGAHWVQDGASFVVSLTDGAWEWHSRAGEVIAVDDLGQGAQFVAGLASGWLVSTPLAEGSYALILAQPADGDVKTTPLVYGGKLDAGFGAGYRVLYAAPLAGTGYPPPATVLAPQTKPTQAPASASCDGFTPLLAPGMIARVTEGDPNRLRDSPSTSGAIVGMIPAGEAVTVLSGPYCVAGIGFWQVDFRGLVGYTAEGMGNAYFLIGEGVG